MRRYVKEIILLVGMMSTTLSAKSNITLEENMGFIGSGGASWYYEDQDAPIIRIEIEDAYKKAGKTEHLFLELKGAYWTEGPNSYFDLQHLEHITSDKIAIAPMDDRHVAFAISIPDELRPGEKLGFSLPLGISTDEDVEVASVKLKPGESSDLVDEKQCEVAIAYTKQALFKVEEVPKLSGDGIMGTLSFTAITPQSLGGQTFQVTLDLEDKDYIFGPLKYTSYKEHEVDIEYQLPPETYIFSEEGKFQNLPQVKLKRYKNTKTQLIFTIEGLMAGETKIYLKHIPLTLEGDSLKEGPLELRITGEALVNAPAKVVIGEKVAQVKEEQLTPLPDVPQQQVPEKKKKVEEVCFPLGATYYEKNGIRYQMEAKSYANRRGHILLPLRDVVEALGDEKRPITYEQGKVRLYHGGQEVLIDLETQKVMKEGKIIGQFQEMIIKSQRVYIEMGELANLLGIEKSWDGEKKIAFLKKIVIK